MSDETLEHAAKALALEVRGHLALHNDELREMTGHTNVGVLKHWMEAVLEALEAAAPHREYGEGDAETLEHAAKLLALTVRGHLGLHDEELREMTGNSNVAVLRHWMEAVFAALAGEGGTEAQHKIDRLRISLESLREHHDETVRRLRKTEQDRDDAYNLLVKAGWVPHWGLKHAEEVIAERVRLYELVTDFLRDIPGDDGCDDPVGAVEGWVRCGSCWPCRIKILRDEISAQPPASDTEGADTLTAGSDNRDVEQVDCSDTEGSADEQCRVCGCDPDETNPLVPYDFFDGNFDSGFRCLDCDRAAHVADGYDEACDHVKGFDDVSPRAQEIRASIAAEARREVVEEIVEQLGYDDLDSDKVRVEATDDELRALAAPPEEARDDAR